MWHVIITFYMSNERYDYSFSDSLEQYKNGVKSKKNLNKILFYHFYFLTDITVITRGLKFQGLINKMY